MKHMSIAQYAAEFDVAKSRWARASLYVRSIPLRWRLWRIARAIK
jgi:hypothetical protein